MKKLNAKKTPFETLILSSFRVASSHLFAWRLSVLSPGVIPSFRFSARRLFDFSPGVISPRDDEKTPHEKTKRCNAKRRNNDRQYNFLKRFKDNSYNSI